MVDDTARDPDGESRVDATVSEHLLAARGSEALSFGSKTGVIEIGEHESAAEVEMSLRMLPSPRIVFEAALGEGTVTAGDGMAPDERMGKLRVPDWYLETEFYRTGIRFGGDAPLMIRGNLPPSPAPFPPDLQVAAVHFAIPNFYDLLAKVPHELGELQRLRWDIRLRGGGWDVCLSKHPHADDTFKERKGSRGFGITHLGIATREDHGPFSGAAATNLLNGLHYFLSFVRGFWCGPALASGLDDSGRTIWQVWNLPSVTAWQSVQGWCDRMNGQTAEAVFPGFWKMWEADQWRESLQRALYRYIGSNLGAAGIEGSTLLSQTGLELLAWTLQVAARRALTPFGFERLPTSDRIRLIVAQSGIPLEIPEPLQALRSTGREYNWDGPEAIAALRNSYVHPGSKASKISALGAEVRSDAWMLSLWYLELLLLYLSGYRGEYSNRLKSRHVGEVELVPWVGPTHDLVGPQIRDSIGSSAGNAAVE